jgi:hypothetical protein
MFEESSDHAQAQTDLNELGISSDYVLFENINVTVHRNNRVDAFRANPTPDWAIFVGRYFRFRYICH